MIKIKRACEPEGVNVNGYSYSIKSYRIALYYFNKVNKEHPLGVDIYLKSQYLGDLRDVLRLECGKILEVDDNYITIEPYPNFISTLSSEECNPEAYMRYIGVVDEERKIAKICSITAFDICVSHIKEEVFYDVENYRKMYNGL